jgi:hypothetical protein
VKRKNSNQRWLRKKRQLPQKRKSKKRPKKKSQKKRLRRNRDEAKPQRKRRLLKRERTQFRSVEHGFHHAKNGFQRP